MSEAMENPPQNGYTDSSAYQVARVYAEALLDAAQAANVANEILEELDTLLGEVVGSDPLLAAFFGGGVVGRDRRAIALKQAGEGRLHPYLLNCLLVLNDHERSGLLRAIRDCYRDMLEQRTGKVRVIIRSAIPLEESHRERLTSLLRARLQREPVLNTHVDPELLGGLVVQVGDFVYDASVRTQIDAIRNQLLERSNHEIQTGRDRFSTADGN